MDRFLSLSLSILIKKGAKQTAVGFWFFLGDSRPPRQEGRKEGRKEGRVWAF
ncbi:hypothetical protein Hanom_Chr02g00153641 [Helianthus anomalus]